MFFRFQKFSWPLIFFLDHPTFSNWINYVSGEVWPGWGWGWGEGVCVWNQDPLKFTRLYVHTIFFVFIFKNFLKTLFFLSICSKFIHISFVFLFTYVTSIINNSLRHMYKSLKIIANMVTYKTTGTGPTLLCNCMLSKKSHAPITIMGLLHFNI